MIFKTMSRSVLQYLPRASALLFGLFLSGSTMSDVIKANPPSGEHVKAVQAASETAEIKNLIDEVTKFVRGRYTIKSGDYYRFRGDVPWVAISKNVQNQMAEKSIQRVIYEWNNPGFDFVDVYPQGDSAFAVAMSSKSSSNKSKLVGYFEMLPKQ